MDYSALHPGNTPIVKVKWQDILFLDNWGEEDESVQPVESATVGYLLEDTPTTIVVASSFDYRNDRWSTIHAFPKSPPEIEVIIDQAPMEERKR